MQLCPGTDLRSHLEGTDEHAFRTYFFSLYFASAAQDPDSRIFVFAALDLNGIAPLATTVCPHTRKPGAPRRSDDKSWWLFILRVALEDITSLISRMTLRRIPRSSGSHKDGAYPHPYSASLYRHCLTEALHDGYKNGAYRTDCWPGRSGPGSICFFWAYLPLHSYPIFLLALSKGTRRLSRRIGRPRQYTTDTQPHILNTSRKQRGRCSQQAGTQTCCRGSHHVYAVESGRLLRVRERVVGRERRSSLRRTTQRVARWTPIPWCSTFLPWFCARGRLTARDASRNTHRNQPATGS